MPRTNFQELLEAGAHFGHLKRKWNPKMAPYIFMEKNGIHVIDLHKTIIKLDEAASVAKQLAKAGRKILFVATKKQAKEIVAEKAAAVNMPYVTERWPGGMLTNFPTIRKAVKKMNTIDKMMVDGTFETLAKREKLQVTRQRAKLEKNLGSIADLNRLPSALFIVDIQKEVNAIKEANRLNIPVIAMVDTCCDPTLVDYVIPANDDAAKSIELITEIICQAIAEGLEERKFEKEKEGAFQVTAPKEGTEKRGRTRRGATKVKIEEQGAAEPKAEAPAEAKEEPKVEAKAEPKADAKVEAAPAKSEAPAETKEEPKVEAKAEPKADAKVEAKVEAAPAKSEDTLSE
ncbi:MAG: 30S ribosomal protein S2 [Bacteroidales bacterium]